MIYELREYTATPDGAEKLHRRFADHTLKLFKKHNMKVAGFWHHADDRGELVYLLEFPDEESRQAAWSAFLADPDWIKAKTDSEADGPILEKVERRMLAPAEYWLPTV